MPDGYVGTLGADVVNDGDVGVIQRSSSPSLRLEAGQPFGVAGVLLGEHLDRHLAPETGVLTEVHHSHAALTERFKDLVMT